ncbi:MAG TPA: excinuclease ABC subunit UvrA, partial [Bacillota bacterium]|nr:excinuclease ABC subunit UvrA [Bacillota bacterium]
FLGQMEKPDLDYIEGLSPAISIDQKTTNRNPRSTVGTVTEIYDYLRLLYARIGTPHCHVCGKEISQQTVDQMVDYINTLEPGTRIQLLAPVIQGKKGEHQKLLEEIKKSGYVRARIDGEIADLNEEIKLEKNKKHTIEVIVDRIIVKEGVNKRLTDSLETVLKLSGGTVLIDIIGKEERLFSQNFACVECGISIEDPAPRMFSFNSPFGKCPVCDGLGELRRIDPDLVIPDKTKSVLEGAIEPWKNLDETSWYYNVVNAAAKHYGFSMNTPICELDEKAVQILLYGNGGEKIKVKYQREYGSGEVMMAFEGIVNNLERRYLETKSNYMRYEIENFMSSVPCPECKGARLKKESLAVTLGGLSIAELCSLSVYKIMEFLGSLKLTEKQRIISKLVLKELHERLEFLVTVGLEYLTLSRTAGTLSGGEAQRIRLATQIGSSLVGVLYILDEPSIGLHQRDNGKLLKALRNLTDLGNTLLVVEHDEETMHAADYIIDMGPGAGAHGGKIVAAGSLDTILACEESVTGQYLSGKKQIPIPQERRKPNGKWIEIKGARENNLKDLDVNIPLGVFTCITGVSGSGKSTLINEILYKELSHRLYGSKLRAGEHKWIKGIEHIDKVIDIDQSPIGRTPRSNPATYTGAFDIIRGVFAATPEAKMKGYNNGRFSFNVRGGRCEACKGDGIIKIEMQFLPDVYVPCEVCKGKRYNRETLEVRYKGKNISEVLNMTVEDALEFFKNIPRVQKKLQTLFDVGLGYIKLGQPSTELSGGEAQRVKLAYELSKRSTGKTVYILDEPTTGLHIADIHKLLGILDRLVDSGNSIIVIEHNLDVIKRADYIIDLGPEGGDRGGTVIAQGTPEEICKVETSYTGQFLKKILAKD